MRPDLKVVTIMLDKTVLRILRKSVAVSGRPCSHLRCLSRGSLPMERLAESFAEPVANTPGHLLRPAC